MNKPPYVAALLGGTGPFMGTALEALATTLHVAVDDLLEEYPELLPPRPWVRIVSVTSEAEIITLVVVRALLGDTSQARWIRCFGVDANMPSRECVASARCSASKCPGRAPGPCPYVRRR